VFRGPAPLLGRTAPSPSLRALERALARCHRNRRRGVRHGRRRCGQAGAAGHAAMGDVQHRARLQLRRCPVPRSDAGTGAIVPGGDGAVMPALHRPGLLVAAAVTVTVPGALAVLAVLGHERVAPEAAYPPPVALQADSLRAAPAGAVPAADQARVRTAAVGIERVSQDAIASAMTTAREAAGLRLLGKSAKAGLATSYQGVELIAQLGVNGAVTMISDVWHRSGGLTITRTTDATELNGGQPYVSYDVDKRSPEGVFGVTKTLVTLLGRHYVAVYRGNGAAVGRPASIVDLHRGDGSLAARFWLDSQTMVPLRRDVYDTSAQLISEDAFVQVQFGSLPAQPGAGNGGSRNKSAWARAEVPAKLVAGLNGSGWHLPAGLPGGLPLYAPARSQIGPGQVGCL